MIPLWRAKYLRQSLLLLVAGLGVAVADDTRLAPGRTINLDAKLVNLTLSPSGDYLYWLNQSDGKLQRAALVDGRLDPRAAEVVSGARAFCLSPDGTTAYVVATTNEYSAYRSGEKQSGTVQAVRLVDLAIGESFGVEIDPLEVVADAKGLLYITPGSGQWEKIYKVDPRQKKVLLGFGQVYGGSNLRITPNRQRLYLATNGLSPGDISATPLPVNSATATVSDSPYHGEYPLGGAFDITPDGKYALNRAGTVVRLGTVKGSDMIFAATVEPNLAAAFDLASNRLWLATADSRLLTYKYPSFELEKTERLLSHGEALAYDAAHSTLWVAWAKDVGGIGGLDAYDLQKPATYPNDISKAREKSVAQASAPARTSAPAAARTAPAVLRSTPAASAAAQQPASPTQTEHASNRSLARRDKLLMILTSACALLFIASLFLGRRATDENPLRHPDANPEDPRSWPLPFAIKFIGWFGWFQVLSVLLLVWFLIPLGESEAALAAAHVLCGIAVIAGALCWGILRGNKICYVLYGLLLIAGTVATAMRGASPALGTVILIFAVIHYGRKHWQALS